MPHFTMEYSSNLDGTVDFDGLCRAVHETILDTGLFELGAVRVRAFRAGLCRCRPVAAEWFHRHELSHWRGAQR